MTYDMPRIDGFLAATLNHVQEDQSEGKTSSQINELLRARDDLGTQTHEDPSTARTADIALAKLDRAIVELHNTYLLLEEVGLDDVLW